MNAVKKSIYGIVMGALVLGMGLSSLAFAPVYAAPRATPNATQVASRSADLTAMYQKEQTWLNTQQTQLNEMNNVVAKLQSLISRAASDNRDTTGLSNALIKFNTTIANANAQHATAASILSTHNGFDSSGNVTDPQAAHQTVVAAHEALNDGHKTMRDGVSALRQALQQWRSSFKPSPSPTATAQS